MWSGPISLPAHTSLQMPSFSFACSRACTQGRSGPPARFDRNVECVPGNVYGLEQLRFKRIPALGCYHLLLHALVHVPKAVQVPMPASATTLSESWGMHTVWTILASSACRPSDVFISFGIAFAHVPEAAQVSLQASADTMNEYKGMHTVWTNLASNTYRLSDVFVLFCNVPKDAPVSLLRQKP